MITKSDWEAVQQEMSEEDRRKLGEPPTAEEMLAYSRGELSGERAGHVRAWLACDPDLARALMEPFPADDAQPGDPDFLSSEEMAKQWTILQQRIGDSPSVTNARVYQFPSRWTALAAAVALVFAGLYWQAESKARRLTRELHEPQALESQLLLPDGRRGGADQATPLSAQGDRIVLDLALFDAKRFESYRVEMRETTDPAQPPWRSEAIRATGEETLSIDVSRTYLKPGKYQIVAFGIAGTREQRLDTYTLRVP